MTSVNGRNGHNGHTPIDGLDAQGNEVSIHSFDQEVAAFAREVHDLYARPVATDLAERHVAAMTAEARRVRIAPRELRAEPEPARPLVLRSRWSLARRLALVGLVTLVAGAGLALAGVRPLDPVRDALEQVGILPDEESDSGQPGGAEGGEKAPSGHENTSNDGQTPGARHAADDADEGQATAEEVRSDETPPATPGRSDDLPEPQGGPPPDSGAPDHAPQGRPESPPGHADFEPGHSAAHRPAAPPGKAE